MISEFEIWRWLENKSSMCTKSTKCGIGLTAMSGILKFYIEVHSLKDIVMTSILEYFNVSAAFSNSLDYSLELCVPATDKLCLWKNDLFSFHASSRY